MVSPLHPGLLRRSLQDWQCLTASPLIFIFLGADILRANETQEDALLLYSKILERRGKLQASLQIALKVVEEEDTAGLRRCG